MTATVYRVEIGNTPHGYREWCTLAFRPMAEDCARARLDDRGCMGNGQPPRFARVVEVKGHLHRVVWAGKQKHAVG